MSVRELNEFGYRFLGPVVTAFFDSMSFSCRESNSKSLYFLAREGYFLKCLYAHYSRKSLISEELKVEYLLCSRAFLFKLMLCDMSKLHITLAHHYQGTLGEFLVRRYGLCGGDIDQVLAQGKISKMEMQAKIKLPRDSGIVQRYMERVHNALREQVIAKEAIYKSYLEDIGFLNSDNPKHVVDIGFSGTIQKALSDLTGQKTVGHYMVTTKNADNTNLCEFNGYLGRDKSFSEGFSLLDRSLFLEAILTAPHGQVVDIFSIDGETRFGFSSNTKAQHQFGSLRAVVEGAKSYMDDVLPESLQLGAEEIPEYYDSLVSNMSGIPRELRAMLDVDDHISGFGIINPVQLFG